MLSQSFDNSTINDNHDDLIKQKLCQSINEFFIEDYLDKKTLDKLKNILTSLKGYKSKDELKFLLNFFLNFKFFRIGINTYGKDLLINILDCCGFIEVEKNEILISVGDTVKSAYILISGKVKISSINPIQYLRNENENNKFKTKDKLNKFLNVFSHQSLKKVNDETNNIFGEGMSKLFNKNVRFSLVIPKRNLRVENDWFVKIGEMFGDKSLIERKNRYYETKEILLIFVSIKFYFN